jgi:DNA polymerase-1
LHPEILNHDLGDLILQELTEEKTSLQDLQGNGKNKLSLNEIKQEAITEFATTEANYIWRLQSILLKKLEEAKLLKLFNKIEMPLITVLAKMEEQGIILNPKPLKSLAKILAKKLEDLSKKIHKISQEDFNINSPKQLQAILFDKLAITSKGLKKTKTGISTADNELEKIKDQHEIIPLIKSYREVSKLQNTYVLALPELINKKDGRLHTNFKQTVASTGRLSSATPNLQNIPTRSAEGREIRRAFEAQKGYRLLGLDYSQIELRLAAHLSKDQKMIKAFLHQEDIHSATAAAINNVKLSEVTKEMRQAAKATNFGILYGQGPHGLSQAAGISYVEARAFIDRYFEVYPNIKKMMDKNIKTAINRGYAETIFKRRRPLPELKSSLMQIKKAGERMAMNMPIQGSAADMIKKAMINIDEIIKNQESEIRLLLQIHDELIFEIRADKLEKYQAIISKLMSEVIKLSVPIIVDSKSAKTWADLK